MTENELRAGLNFVRLFIDAYEDEIVALARGRFALGAVQYPHGPLFKKSREELAADLMEELADASVYARRRLELP